MSISRRMRILLVWAVVTALSSTTVCMAASPLSGSLVLGYGEEYRTPAGSSIHRGVDVALAAGEAVPAMIDGVVTFAGRVPSGAGGSIRSITVSAGDDAVTVSPIDEIRVVRGQRVKLGATLGTLAYCGDPSSEVPHLHVSLRRNGVYVDPSALLPSGAFAPGHDETAPDRAPEVVAVPELLPFGRVEPVAGTGTVVTEPAVVIGGNLTAPEQCIEPQPSPVAQDSGVPVQQGSASPQGVGVVQPRSSAVPVVSSPTEGMQSAGSAAAAGISAFGSALRENSLRGQTRRPGAFGVPRIAEEVAVVDRSTGMPHAGAVCATTASGRTAPGGSMNRRIGPSVIGGAAQPSALILLAAMTFGTLYVASRRIVERGIRGETPVSDRFGSMLQHLRAGDTLCGLTSCSGLLPSQSRGRLAQRR